MDLIKEIDGLQKIVAEKLLIEKENIDIITIKMNEYKELLKKDNLSVNVLEDIRNNVEKLKEAYILNPLTYDEVKLILLYSDLDEEVEDMIDSVEPEWNGFGWVKFKDLESIWYNKKNNTYAFVGTFDTESSGQKTYHIMFNILKGDEINLIDKLEDERSLKRHGYKPLLNK